MSIEKPLKSRRKPAFGATRPEGKPESDERLVDGEASQAK
jgi:hypothetical protein